MSQIITLIIGAASVYFFYTNTFIIALILFTWFLSRLFGYNLKRTFEGLGHSEVEHQSNIVLELKINIVAILSHKAVSDLFERLQDGKKSMFRSEFKFSDKTKWVEQMIENYKKKYNNENDWTNEGQRFVWDVAKFNIKNNILWKNGQIDFSDSIEHELIIPYEFKGKEDDDSMSWNGIDSRLRVRVIVVNGMIKIQIGSFDKESSPQVYRDSFLAAYKTWETITTFPLMYVSQSIPTHYLNLSMYATESYKDLLKSENKDWTRDWKALNAQISDYNRLKTATDESVNNSLMEILKKFTTKSNEMLEAEGFADPYKKKDDKYVPGWLEDNSINYLNDFLYVFIADYKDIREKNEKYYLTDFYEDYP